MKSAEQFAYNRAFSKASAYGWSARIARKMARAVVKLMRSGASEEAAVKYHVARKPETRSETYRQAAEQSRSME